MCSRRNADRQRIGANVSGRGDRRIRIADTALRFHRAPPSGNIIYDSFAERARMIRGVSSRAQRGTSHKLIELQQGTLACRWKMGRSFAVFAAQDDKRESADHDLD